LDVPEGKIEIANVSRGNILESESVLVSPHRVEHCLAKMLQLMAAFPLSGGGVSGLTTGSGGYAVFTSVTSSEWSTLIHAVFSREAR
jgi:hypothetical protein